MFEIKIIGSGISGLVTAYYLQKRGFKVVVYDSAPSAGGLIRTIQSPYGLIETGANGFLSTARVEDLLNELDITWAPTQKESRNRYIYRGELKRWPLGVVESAGLLSKTSWRSLLGKKAFKPFAEESLQDWGYRVLGQAATDQMVAPALQGIYAGDPKKLSATLILNRFFRPTDDLEHPPTVRGTIAPVKGMGDLIETLKSKLAQRGVEFVHNKKIESLSDKEEYIIAVPAYEAAKLLEKETPQLSRIQMLPIISITAFFPQNETDPKGFGCLFPRDQGIRALGVLWNNHIFANRSQHRSETWILGGALDLQIDDLDDDELMRVLMQDRQKVLGHRTNPLDVRIQRWPKALPHYDTTLEYILSQGLKTPRNIHLIGNYMGGLGLSKIVDRAYNMALNF